MSRASAFTPEHAQQLNTLRQWARKQGKTPSGLSKTETHKQALAQGRTSTTSSDDQAKPTGTPAPENSDNAT